MFTKYSKDGCLIRFFLLLSNCGFQYMVDKIPRVSLLCEKVTLFLP